jgi:hypothetical protein
MFEMPVVFVFVGIAVVVAAAAAVVVDETNIESESFECD